MDNSDTSSNVFGGLRLGYEDRKALALVFQIVFDYKHTDERFGIERMAFYWS